MCTRVHASLLPTDGCHACTGGPGACATSGGARADWPCCVQGTPAPLAEVAEGGSPAEDSVARYWAGAQPQPQVLPPQWLADGLHMLAHLPVADALTFCLELQSLLSILHPTLRFTKPSAAEFPPAPANGTLGVFMAPAPADGKSRDLFDAADSGGGGSVYVMLQHSRPLRSLALVCLPLLKCCPPDRNRLSSSQLYHSGPCCSTVSYAVS